MKWTSTYDSHPEVRIDAFRMLGPSGFSFRTRLRSQHLIWLLALLVFVSACSNDDEPQHSYDHTVLLYFPWSGSKTSGFGGLYTEFLSNIQSIKTSIVRLRGTGSTRVLVMLATSSTQGQLYEIVYADGVVQEKQLKQYSDWTFTDKSHIRTMLNDVAAYAQTPTYSILIGSHGMGWLPRESTPGKKYAFGGTTPEMMTDIEVLDSAIVESSIKHLDFLCFDDCYMANIETAYLLRNTVDYLIASTSEIMSIGLPYSDVWKYMQSKKPDYPAIVSAFHEFYSSYDYPYGALSVVDCRKAEQAAGLVRQMNVLMAAHNVSPSDVEPQYLDGFSAHVFFDMKDYTDQVAQLLPTVSTLSSDFDALYADLVVAHSSTSSLYSAYLGSGNDALFPVETNCGITISDPTVNRQATPYIQHTAWWAATH
jgi:hypothetical protein